MLVKEVIQKTTTFFRDKGFSSPRLDTELLMAKALNWDRVKIYMNYDYPLSEQELATCRDLVKRRAQGEPVAYILGTKDFYKSTFVVQPGVLIPRPETESIVEMVCDWYRTLETEPETFSVVDFGCGSGCIGLSILNEISAAKLLAVDSSATAIDVTTKNAESLGLSERTKTHLGEVESVSANDVEAHFACPVGSSLPNQASQVDVVVANPPYIAETDPDVAPDVKAFEPEAALFSEEEGLAHIRRWSKKASELLRPKGLCVFEIGHLQGQSAFQIFSDLGTFKDIIVVKDLSQKDRFIRCVKQ